MTYLQLVNSVLRRLRRNEVTSVATSTYAKMVGDLVNQAKREVEDAWQWLPLREEFSGTLADTGTTLILTDWGQRYRITEVHDTTSNARVPSVTHRKFNEATDFTSTTTGAPQWWRINGESGGDPILEFYPTANAAYNVSVYGVVAQADLVNNTDELTVPDWPVMLKAYSLALSERGEDGGALFDETVREYQSALNDAIARDNANHAFGHTSDWVIA